MGNSSVNLGECIRPNKVLVRVEQHLGSHAASARFFQAPTTQRPVPLPVYFQSQLNGSEIGAIEPLRAGDRIRASKFLFNVVTASAPSEGPMRISVVSNIREEESDDSVTQQVQRSEEDDLVAEMEDIFN